MKKLAIVLLSFVLISLSNIQGFSQGCSDAGVCTLNTLKGHTFGILQEIERTNHIRAGITNGIGEYDINITTPYVEFSSLLMGDLTLAGKLSYAFINGELASTSNLSDLIISATKTVYERELTALSFSLAGKVPLNDANIKQNDNALPMHYQTSLGTYDLIAGFNFTYLDFGYSMALQQPIINSNENEFVSPTGQSLKEAKYQTTNSFKRKGDLMGRASYNIDVVYNKFIIRPSLLAIYHLSNDTFIDQNDIEQEIDGSQGLTLNANVFISFYFENHKQLELAIGAPFVTRESRPDGLTRELVLGLEYTYSF